MPRSCLGSSGNATQPDSIGQAAVAQASLPLSRRALAVDVPLDVIRKRATFLAAINLMFDVSGLDDKEISLTLEIDPGHFSNIRRGKQGSHFPVNKLEAAMDLCENEIPLLWLADRRGKGVYMLLSEAERQLIAEREARIRAEDRLGYLESLVTGTKT